MLPTNKDGETGIVDYSGRLLTTDNIRFEVSRGNAYRFAIQFAAVPAGQSRYAWFDPSANGAYPGRVYKIKASVRSTANPVTMLLYEGAVISSNGTEVIIYNFNRNVTDSSLNPYAPLYHTPTITSNGTKYAPDMYIFASTTSQGQLEITAPGDGEDEFSAHLNPTKKYLWVFQNATGEATTISIVGRIIYEQDYRAGGR